MAGQPSSERATRGADTRERILAAAEELFSARGFAATSVREIGRCCGVTDAAVFYYFPTKQDILSALLKGPSIEPLEPCTGPFDPEAAAGLVLDVFYRWLEQPGLHRILAIQAFDGDSTAQAFTARMVESYISVVGPMLKPVCGERTQEVLYTLLISTSGEMYGAMLDDPAGYADALRSPRRRARLREIVLLALPVKGAR
jgi:AcrR family transcriptional regulator